MLYCFSKEIHLLRQSRINTKLHHYSREEFNVLLKDTSKQWAPDHLRSNQTKNACAEFWLYLLCKCTWPHRRTSILSKVPKQYPACCHSFFSTLSRKVYCLCVIILMTLVLAHIESGSASDVLICLVVCFKRIHIDLNCKHGGKTSHNYACNKLGHKHSATVYN